MYRKLRAFLRKLIRRGAMRPALFLLDDCGESWDVRYFCGAYCREQYQIRTEDKVAVGESSDWITGTVCDRCGEPL